MVLNPNDEYRDAVEVLELALDLGEGSGATSDGTTGTGGGAGAKKTTASPQKLDKARRVRESLGGLQHNHHHQGSPDRCESRREIAAAGSCKILRGVRDVPSKTRKSGDESDAGPVMLGQTIWYSTVIAGKGNRDLWHDTFCGRPCCSGMT